MSNNLVIPIDQDYLCNGKMYKMDHIEIHTGINMITGCNGSGKSTLLHQIKEYAQRNKIIVYSYNNVSDGSSNMMNTSLMLGNLELLATMSMSSEGEGICVSLSKVFSDIGRLARKYTNQKIIVLLDGIDSGVSIDSVIEIKTQLNNIAEVNKENSIEMYFVCTANDFEFIKEYVVMDAMSGKFMAFDDYLDYKRYILDTAKKKKTRDDRWERNGKRRAEKEDEEASNKSERSGFRIKGNLFEEE